MNARKGSRLVAGGVLLLLGLLSGFVQAADIKSVRLWRAPDNTRLVFDLSGPAEHTLFTLSNPERIVIDISNARLMADTSALALENTPLRGLRAAPRDGDGLRVVLRHANAKSLHAIHIICDAIGTPTRSSLRPSHKLE